MTGIDFDTFGLICNLSESASLYSFDYASVFISKILLRSGLCLVRELSFGLSSLSGFAFCSNYAAMECKNPPFFALPVFDSIDIGCFGEIGAKTRIFA